MKLVDKLPQKDDLCFVGDLIDRGPDSKKVVDFVKDNNHKCVMGNHEVFLIDSLYTNEIGSHFYNINVYNIWLYNGGKETLKSFGGEIWDYLEWFNSLPLYIEYGNFLITHTYAANGKYTDKDSIVWSRDFSKPIRGNIINIFGHTIHKKPKKYFNKHWCIDTGAHHFGVLTALDLDTMKFYFSTSILNF